MGIGPGFRLCPPEPLLEGMCSFDPKHGTATAAATPAAAGGATSRPAPPPPAALHQEADGVRDPRGTRFARTGAGDPAGGRGREGRFC